MRKLLPALAVVAASCTAQPPQLAPPIICESFSSVPIGSRIVVGPSPASGLSLPTMTINGHPFQNRSGGINANGFAEVRSQGRAGGSGNELAINNITTSIDVGSGIIIQRLKLGFGEFGGSLNLWINDDFRNFGNFADINGALVGGLQVRVLSGGGGQDQGQVEFVGGMRGQRSGLGQFALGGQELWIDDICYTR
jgi:hypothetical protein